MEEEICEYKKTPLGVFFLASEERSSNFPEDKENTYSDEVWPNYS